jgi:3-phosphoshikimate 1-carboxyvinyltransferase
MAGSDPVLCVTGAEPDVGALANRLAGRGPSDLHEVRLDLLSGDFDTALDLVARHGSRLVVTCRPERHGGGFRGAEDDRRDLLRRAAAAGARWIDLELGVLESDGSGALPADRILASWHGDIGDPGFPAVAERLQRAGTGAVKAAVTVRGAADLIRLRTWRAGLPTVASVVGMGPAGLWTRVRPGDFDSAWTYVAAGPGLETWPDQPSRARAVAHRVAESRGLSPIVLFGGPWVVDSPGPCAYNRLFARRGDPFQYLAVPAASWDEAAAFAREFGVSWLSVTRPFKRAAFLASPWRDSWAMRAGVANTVRLDGGRPVACWNTDVRGFLGALADTGSLAHLDVLFLGAGDTTQALASGVRFAGGAVSMACRDPAAVKARMAGTDGAGTPLVPWGARASVPHRVLVQATPLDGLSGDAPWPEEAPLASQRVVDVVLPVTGTTRLVSRAREAGIPVIDGLDFWVHQGVAQAACMTGRFVAYPELAQALDPSARCEGEPQGGVRDREPTIEVPGSKSLTQRFLVLAALADGPSRLAAPSPGVDSLQLASALEALGTGVLPTRDGWCVVPGTLRPPAGPIPCGQGGTTARFVAAMSLAWDGELSLALAPPLGDRPMAGLVDALVQAGKAVSLERDGTGGALLRIAGPALSGGRLAVDASESSQFASALMLAGAALPRGIEVALSGRVVSSGYLDMTVHALRAFGVVVTPTEAGWRVAPGRPRATDLRVEGDWSLGAFWRVAARIAGPGPDVVGLGAASGQADRRIDDLLATLDGAGEREIDLEAVPDLLPPLVIAALFRAGATTFGGIGHARLKESDRPAVLAKELAKVGARVTCGEGTLRVDPAPLAGPARLDPHDDHRMAMAFGLLSLAVPGAEVLDRRCVAKSYPAFFSDLETWRAAGDRGRALVLVGMRGAGKTTVGRLLAARLGRPFVDSDEAVQAQLGSTIDDLFRSGRVAEFRRCEADAIREMLHRDVVLATGGGCVEDPDTVAALADAFTVWLDGPAEVLARRVATSERPSVTGAPVADELPYLATARAPAYAACARLRLDTGSADPEAVCDAIEHAWNAFSDRDLR